MKTATFNIAMADEVFPAATPVPTEVRVHAVQVSLPDKVATAPWDASDASVQVPLTFDELTEAGMWQGFVELVSGSVVLKALSPIAFVIPAGPTTVTYRSPAGFTVTVG